MNSFTIPQYVAFSLDELYKTCLLSPHMVKIPMKTSCIHIVIRIITKFYNL